MLRCIVGMDGQGVVCSVSSILKAIFRDASGLCVKAILIYDDIDIKSDCFIHMQINY